MSKQSVTGSNPVGCTNFFLNMKNKLVFLLSVGVLVLSQSCATSHVYRNGKKQTVRRNQVDVIHSGHAPKNWLFGKNEGPCSAHW